MFCPVQLIEDIEEHLRKVAPIHVALRPDIQVKRDHIGYRCDSKSSYEVKFNDLAQQAGLVREIVVARRRIAVFRLEEEVCQFPAFALQAARADEEPWEGVEHLGYVVENLEQCHELLAPHDEFRVLPIKQVGAGRYFKMHLLGIEIEFRDKPIEER